MWTVARALVPALLVTLVVTTVASADTIYTYTGDFFAPSINGFTRTAGVYSTADRITGSFMVRDGFVPIRTTGGDALTDGVVTWSFTDGHQTLTPDNSAGRFYLSLEFNVWNILVGQPNLDALTGGGISTSFFGERIDSAWLDANNWGRNSGGQPGPQDGSHIGTWTVSVPEPMSLVLVAAGIAGLFAARRFYRS